MSSKNQHEIIFLINYPQTDNHLIHQNRNTNYKNKKTATKSMTVYYCCNQVRTDYNILMRDIRFHQRYSIKTPQTGADPAISTVTGWRLCCSSSGAYRACDRIRTRVLTCLEGKCPKPTRPHMHMIWLIFNQPFFFKTNRASRNRTRDNPDISRVFCH